MNILLNYSSGGRFSQSQLLNSQTGLAAGFNVVHQMSEIEIDPSFFTQHSAILGQGKGAGYWLWKPYFLDRILSVMGEQDVLFYADSGSVFVKHMSPVLKAVREDHNGVTAFRMSGKHTEKYWTKRDVFRALGAQTTEYTDTPQIGASFMAFRGTAFAKAFVREYLNFCCDPHLVGDEPNSDGWVEPGFQDNRHDQSIWSVLVKKHRVSVMPDLTQWGLHHGETTDADMYINHTRDSR